MIPIYEIQIPWGAEGDSTLYTFCDEQLAREALEYVKKHRFNDAVLVEGYPAYTRESWQKRVADWERERKGDE